MKNILKKNWRILFLFYIVIYLPWFFYVEKIIGPDFPGLHIIHCALDDVVPFCEIFIIPYLIWFAYMAVTCLYVFIKGTDSEYLRLALSLLIGMSLSLAFYMIYPNGHHLRPDLIADKNIFTQIISMIYTADTSTNVFPSIHVYNSIAVHLSIINLSSLNHKKLIKYTSLVLCILICLSTVFLKQHSVLDGIGAVILSAIIYIFIYKINYNRFFNRSTKTTE